MPYFCAVCRCLASALSCADMYAADDAFLVPTTVTYAALQREGVAAGMPAELVAKVGEAVSKVRVVLYWPLANMTDTTVQVSSCYVDSYNPTHTTLPRHNARNQQHSKLGPSQMVHVRSSTASAALSSQVCVCVCVFLYLLHPLLQGLEAMAIARASHVKMALGSDLLGAMHK